MPLTGRENVFSTVCSIIVKQDCAACICEGVLKTVTNSNADIEMAQKIQRGGLFVQEKRVWITKNIRRRSNMFFFKSCQAQKNRYKKHAWKPRFHQQQFGSS